MKLTHWFYNFVLHTRNFTNEFRLGTNPFTGEQVKFPIDDGLTTQQLRSVEDVFERNGIVGPEPEFEGYVVYGLDGESLRIRGADLKTEKVISLEVEITVKRLRDEIVSLIFDITNAGNFALMTPTGDCVRLINSVPSATILERWPDVQAITSIAELRKWIEEQVGSRKVGHISRSMLEEIARANERLEHKSSQRPS